MYDPLSHCTRCGAPRADHAIWWCQYCGTPWREPTPAERAEIDKAPVSARIQYPGEYGPPPPPFVPPPEEPPIDPEQVKGTRTVLQTVAVAAALPVGLVAGFLILGGLAIGINRPGGIMDQMTTMAAKTPTAVAAGTREPTVAAAATQPSPLRTLTAATTATLAPSASGTAARTTTPASRPTVSATAGPMAPAGANLIPVESNLYTGVKIYLRSNRGLFGEITGRSTNCPKSPDGKAVKIRRVNGEEMWGIESNLTGLSGFVVDEADPAIQAKQTTMIDGCP